MTAKESKNISTDTSKYERLGTEIGILVAEKQIAYGDSFGKSGVCLRQMFPNGIRLEQYDDVLTIARIIDKLFRIANNKDAFGENPYKDICGYALLAVGRDTQTPLKEPELEHDNNSDVTNTK